MVFKINKITTIQSTSDKSELRLTLQVVFARCNRSLDSLLMPAPRFDVVYLSVENAFNERDNAHKSRGQPLVLYKNMNTYSCTIVRVRESTATVIYRLMQT